MGEGATGMAQDDRDEVIFEAASMNTFTDNTYVHYTPDSFFWDNRELEPAEWQAFGNDVEGVFKGKSRSR